MGREPAWIHAESCPVVIMKFALSRTTNHTAVVPKAISGIQQQGNAKLYLSHLVLRIVSVAQIRFVVPTPRASSNAAQFVSFLIVPPTHNAGPATIRGFANVTKVTLVTPMIGQGAVSSQRTDVTMTRNVPKKKYVVLRRRNASQLATQLLAVLKLSVFPRITWPDAHVHRENLQEMPLIQNLDVER